MQAGPSGDSAEAARRLLQVSPQATPQEIENAYLCRVSELRAAFLDLGGFPRDPQQKALRFDTFVVGQSNAEAFQLARRVASAPAPTCNPLFIHGSCGLGKTHLLQAIANEASQQRRFVLYCSAQSFVEEMILSMARNRLQEFREKYRHPDYLLMDDVQVLSGRSQAQDETYAIFNQLLAAGAQVVVAGRSEPEAIEQLGPGLKSRLNQSVPVSIGYPELPERQEIVFRKAGDLGLDLPRPLAYYLAKQYATDVRALESAVRRLDSHVRDGCRLQTCQDVETLLYGTATRPRHGCAKPTLGDVQEVASRHFNLKIRDLVEGKGSLKVKRARQIAIYLSREVCDASVEDLRKSFRAEPSQIAYALKKIKNSLSDPTVQQDIRAITEALLQLGDG